MLFHPSSLMAYHCGLSSFYIARERVYKNLERVYDSFINHRKVFENETD